MLFYVIKNCYNNLIKHEQIIKFIIDRRNQLNLSQSDIANSVGYSSQLIYNWEKGKSLPDLSIISGLCNTLSITLNEFFSCEIKNEYKGKIANFDFNKFSENIKKLRIVNSLTQKDIAKKVGVSYATVISWEKGNSCPNLIQFVILKEIFSVSYEDLYYAKFVSSIPAKKSNKRIVISFLIPLLIVGLGIGSFFGIKSILDNNNKKEELIPINPDIDDGKEYVTYKYYSEDGETLLYSKQLKNKKIVNM